MQINQNVVALFNLGAAVCSAIAAIASAYVAFKDKAAADR
jgi:hypothetical protein